MWNYKTYTDIHGYQSLIIAAVKFQLVLKYFMTESVPFKGDIQSGILAKFYKSVDSIQYLRGIFYSAGICIEIYTDKFNIFT